MFERCPVSRRNHDALAGVEAISAVIGRKPRSSAQPTRGMLKGGRNTVGKDHGGIGPPVGTSPTGVEGRQPCPLSFAGLPCG